MFNYFRFYLKSVYLSALAETKVITNIENTYKALSTALWRWVFSGVLAIASFEMTRFWVIWFGDGG
jgi:hypothetical protein